MSLLFCLTLAACSSTQETSNNQLTSNGYSQGYIGTNYSHTQFTPISKSSIKKPLNSDHQLMMSLLNRPMTADQAMMLAFAQERASYANTFANNVQNGIFIKGSKASDTTTHRAQHVYAQQISQDINGVSISAPK